MTFSEFGTNSISLAAGIPARPSPLLARTRLGPFHHHRRRRITAATQVSLKEHPLFAAAALRRWAHGPRHLFRQRQGRWPRYPVRRSHPRLAVSNARRFSATSQPRRLYRAHSIPGVSGSLPIVPASANGSQPSAPCCTRAIASSSISAATATAATRNTTLAAVGRGRPAR